MRHFIALTLLPLWACAPALQLPNADGGDKVGGPDAGLPPVVSLDEGHGVLLTTTDATRSDRWIYLDLDSALETTAENPGWDLGVQRFKIKTNSGISGNGGVKTAVLTDVDFASVTQAPAETYREDAADSDDEGSSEDFTFLAPEPWYAYESTFHTLSPQPLVFVVRSTAGAYFKIQLTGYYDTAGTPGWLQFRWAPVTAP